MSPPAVTHRENYSRFGSLTVSVLVIGIGYLHYKWMMTSSDWRAYLAGILYAWTAFLTLSAHWDQPCIKRPPKLVVDAVIASLGDNLDRLRVVLESMAIQTIPPRTLYVILNGDEGSEAKKIFEDWSASPGAQVIKNRIFWTQSNPDKREAHELAILDTTASVLMMVDSTTRLDPHAVKEGLRAFANSKVRSVGGLLIHEQSDNRSNLLSRLLGLSFEASYMHDKAAFSQYKSVTVNRGGLAFIRVPVARNALPAYLDQRMRTGDDRELTLAAAANEGKTVFQESSVGYIPHPSDLNTASRRHVRWWCAYWQSTATLLCQFSPKRVIWHLSLMQSVMFALYGVAVPLALIDALVTSNSLWQVVGYIVAMAYLRFARTLAIRRPDQSFAAQATSFAFLVPLAALLELWTYVALMWYGMTTVRRTT